MEEKKKGFIAWVKAHRKQLLVSGVSVSAILLVILGIKNKETMLDLWNFLENSITKVPEKLPENMNLEHLTLPAIDEDFSVRVYTSPQEAFDVRQHIRNLSGGRQHSIEKAAEAAMLGIPLLPNQTIVDTYTKYAA